MNSVEKVKLLCKERKIPISHLEKQLGFANGYISQLKKGTLPDDRLILIARFFDVPIESLMNDVTLNDPIYLAFSGAGTSSSIQPPDSCSVTWTNDKLFEEIGTLYVELTTPSKKHLLEYAKRLLKYDSAVKEMKQAKMDLNAAHERTDIEITKEMKEYDDDIMNDPNF